MFDIFKQFRGKGTNKKSATYAGPCAKIGLINCRSVKTDTESIHDFIISRKLDCVALTETWLKGTADDNVALAALVPKGYRISHVPRAGDIKGGGVALIYKEHLLVTTDTLEVTSSFEAMNISITLASFVFRFIIIYRIPPSPKNKILRSSFLVDFADMLESIAISPGKLVILGDFNIHWDNKANSETKQFASLLESFGLKQYVDTATHIAGHIIDFVLSRASDNNIFNCSSSDFISDHNTIVFDLACGRPHAKRQEITYRKIKSVDIDEFKSDVTSNLSNEPISVDTMVSEYNDTLSNLLNKHAPEKTKSVAVRDDVPWITPEILEAKRTRRRTEKSWKKNPLTVHRLEYKRQCRNVQSLIKISKSSYYSEKINQCEGDQKKLFKIVDSLLGRGKSTKLPTSSSSFELAEKFNSFFSVKIYKIRENLDDMKDSVDNLSFDISSSLHSSHEKVSEFAPASEEEIQKIILNASNATCASDPVPSSFVKKILSSLLTFVTMLVNMCLSFGQFPSNLKSAIVCPLLKKPTLDPEELKHYRPVSNLSFLSKVIEKVIANRLVQHLKKFGLIDIFQSAYRKCHSTETALLKVQNDVLKQIDKGRQVYLILLDLSAAFDTIDQNILIEFLQNYVGLCGPALDIFKSYLSNRTQKISINGMFSAMQDLLFGVPQGSVLGPLVFCIYTLPLCAILRHHNIDYHIYADDTQLYCSFDSNLASDTLDKIMLCIKDIRSWMIQNKLKINDDKTEFLVLSSPRAHVNKDLSLQIGGASIVPSSKCRNLGVVFDQHMTMDAQVANVAKCMMFHLRSIAKIRHLITDIATIQLVHALVTSRLDYCNSLLYGLPDSLIGKLQRVQNIAARIVTRSKQRCHITPILHNLHWLPVKSRIIFKILLLTFHSIHGTAPKYLKDMVTCYTPSRDLRSSSKDLLVIPNVRLKTYGERCFEYGAAKEWNLLPDELRECTNLNTFKTKLKTHLFRKYFDC